MFSSYWPIKLAAYFSYFSLELELELDEDDAEVVGFLEELESLEELLVLRVDEGRHEEELDLELELLEESLELDPRELEELR